MQKWSVGLAVSCAALFACPGPSATDGGTGGGAGGGAGGGGGASYQTPISPTVDAFGHALTESGGKLYAAGVGVFVDGGTGGPNLMLARFDATGARDTSFGADGVVLLDTGGDGGVPPFKLDYDEARDVLVDGDKVLVVGTGRGPTTGPGGYSFILARFNLDGTPDTTFGTNGLSVLTAGASVESAWNAVAKLPSGKYLVGGTIHNGATRGNDFVLARYDTNGSIDATYTAGAGAGAIDDFGGTDEHGLSVVLQGDKAVIGGGVGFTVARHQASGPLDLSFGTSGVYRGGPGSLYKVLTRADGKLLLVGTHTTTSGSTTQNHLKLQLLSADGVAEPSFGVGGTQEIPLDSGVPRGAALDGDGKLWVYLAGLGEAKVARVNADGTLDTSFGTMGFAASGAHLPLLQPLLNTSVNRLVVVGGKAWVTDLTVISTPGGGTDSVFFLGSTP